MEAEIKNKKINYRKLIIFLFITLAFFIGFRQIQYSTDTYAVFNQPIKETIKIFCQSSRFVTATFSYAVYILGFSNATIYSISFIMAIIFFTLSLYNLSEIIEKESNSKNTMLTIIIPILIIINPFSIELLFYIEKGVMALSVFFNIIALDYLIKYLKGDKKSVFCAMLFMLLSNFSYQGTVAIFICLGLIYIIKYAKNTKNFIVNNLIAALCYGIPAYISLLISKIIFNNNRINGEKNLWLSINKIYNSMDEMIVNTYEILPKYLLLVLLIYLFLILTIYVIKENKKIVLNISSIIYIIIGVTTVSILPQLMQNPESIWFVPRSTYAFASILGILLLYLYSKFKLNKVIDYILEITMIIFLIIQLGSFTNIIKDNYIVNYMDKSVAMEINSVINDYETENDITISKIVFYGDNNLEYTYPNLWCSKDMNIKAFYPEWSRQDVIEEYTGLKLEKGEINEEVKTKFENQNWTSFSKKQIICIDDTVHICVY